MNKEDKVEVSQESRMASSEIRRKSGMDSSEVYKKYIIARRLFYKELRAIQKEYIASHFNFKEGDVILFKRFLSKKPSLAVIDSIHFNICPDYPEEDCYKNPLVRIWGHYVDEDGYNILSSSSNEPIEVIVNVDEVIEGTRRYS